VDNFCDLVGDLPDPLPAIVSIGPITSTTAQQRGIAVTTEADPHTIDGLVTALLVTLAPPVVEPDLDLDDLPDLDR
jgi:uroporphyrinogen-III synthase